MGFGGGFFGGPGMGGAGGGRGLPFAGIPDELAEPVNRLVATEPDHGDPDAHFTQHAEPGRRLSIRGLFLEHKAYVAVAFAVVIVETLSIQSGPLLAQIAIDDGIERRSVGVVLACGLIYIATVIIAIVAGRKRTRVTGRLAASVIRSLRVRVFTHLQRLSLDFFTEEKAGVIMTRMTNDIEQLQQLMQDGFSQFTIQGLTMVIVTIVLFSDDVRLAFVTLVIVVPTLTLLSIWFSRASEAAYRRVRDAIAGVLSHLSESLAGARVITLYNRRSVNVAEHRVVVGNYRWANSYGAHVQSLYGAGSSAIGLFGQMVILLVGGDMVIHHQLGVGELLAFILYLGSFFQPIQQLVQLYNTYQQGQAGIMKLRGLLGTAPSVLESAEAVELGPVQGEIAFCDVGFAYQPGEPVLEHVDLTIAAGETVAFVGPTGAGKSTIAKLVPRFYDPTTGKITLDGHDLRDVEIESLRRQLGVVPQEPYLFSGTIRENIAFSRPDASDAEIAEAVRAVGLTGLVERLPEGLDTPVHERGQSLSSGERQLVALARAFLARPRVLVLDEATSNLDLGSESLVEAGLDALLEGRTAILIAHRLSTAMRADRVVVVDQGRVVEIGTHARLIASGGRYAKMYETWTSHNGTSNASGSARSNGSTGANGSSHGASGFNANANGSRNGFGSSNGNGNHGARSARAVEPE